MTAGFNSPSATQNRPGIGGALIAPLPLELPETVPAKGRLPDSYGILHVDTSDQPALSVWRMRAINRSVENDERLTPQVADAYLETDSSVTPSLVRELAPAYGPVLGNVAAASVKTAIEHNPDLPSLGTFPVWAHDLLNNSTGWLPDAFAASNAEVIQHAPPAIQGLGLAAGVLQFAFGGWKKKIMEDAQKDQAVLRERIGKGDQAWDLSESPNSAVALVGYGKPTAASIAKEMSGDIVQISYWPVKGLNVVMPSYGGKTLMTEALQQADAEHADAIYIFPNAASNAILPHTECTPKDYDISLPQIGDLITLVDEGSERSKKPYKPLLVFGSDKQVITSSGAPDFSLSMLICKKNLQRQAKIATQPWLQPHPATGAASDSIHLVNETQALLQEAARLSPGRVLELTGTPDSMERYKKPFDEALEHLPGYAPDITLAPRHVVLNIDDGVTVTTAKPHVEPPDLPIVKHATHYRPLLNAGFEQVLVVPEVTRTVVKKILDQYSA